jgi:anti-sigma factor RsiW
MREPQHHFNEVLISGYLDGELTQEESQRVRLHLEECATCRATSDDLARIREATVDSRFSTSRDVQWDEAPRSGTSRLLRNAGLLIGLAWLFGIIGYMISELADTQDVVGILLVGGMVVSAALILASAYLDRREARKTDRYQRVEK